MRDQNPSKTSIIHKTWLRRTVKYGLITLVGVSLFVSGLGIGSGHIRLHQLKSQQSASLPKVLDYNSVQQVYNVLRADYDGKLDENALLDGLKEGLAKATGDPYTEFFNDSQAKDFNSQLNGTFSGIGAELGKNGDNIVIISPISGFPAAKAGLKPKDIISQIDGTSTSNMNIDEAVSKIRGPKGTDVKLTVIRDGKQLNFTITRDNITIPSVNTKVLPGNIGYIQITRFADDTSDLATKAAKDLKAKGVNSVILDVRGDPGGLLTAAENVASLWLPEGKTVLQERRGGVVQKTYYATGTPILNGLPTVVLVDDGSASASEIVSGALHDNGVATLIGIKTYGKGSVQQLESIPSGGMLKVTVARWYTPGGRNIDKQGIQPDKIVKLTDNDIKKGNDTQLQAAENYLKNH